MSDTSTKAIKKKVSINKFKPKIIMIEESSSKDENRKTESSDSIEESGSDELESDDLNITYEQFNILPLNEKQEIITKQIKNTHEGSLKEEFQTIDKIIKFLIKYNELVSHKCFELTSDDDINTTLIKGIKKEKYRNVTIYFKTIKILYKNDKIQEFLQLFTNFYNVSVQIIIKNSMDLFNDVNSIIQDFRDNDYTQYNIEITIKESTVDESKFAYNSNIITVILSPIVQWVEKHAFLKCKSLQRVIISDSVKEIKVGAFQGCSFLQNIIIPNSVQAILEFAFAECKSITKVKLPSSLEIIRIGTFRNCKSLQDIVLPSSVRKIKRNAFRNCSSLKQIEFPDNIKYIGECAFENCKSLKHIKISNEVIYEENTFIGCINLKNMPKNKPKPNNGIKKVKNVKRAIKVSSDDDDDSFD